MHEEALLAQTAVHGASPPKPNNTSYQLEHPNANAMAKGSQSRLLSPTIAIASSENRNPNVSSGSHKRKANNRPKASATAASATPTPSPPFENDDPSENTTGQACDLTLVSPPRKHTCTSRRCASKNPDYAMPVTVHPKKFLVSKGHTLPAHEAGVCKCFLRNRKGGCSAADDKSSTKHCSRCPEPHLRRWSSNDNASGTAGIDSGVQQNEKQTTKSSLLTSAEAHGTEEELPSPYVLSDAQELQASNPAVFLKAAETAHRVRSTDLPMSRDRPNDLPEVDQTQFRQEISEGNHLKTAIDDQLSEESRSPPAATHGLMKSFDRHRPMDSCYDSDGRGLQDKPGLQASSLPQSEWKSYEEKPLLSEPEEGFPAADTADQQDGSPVQMREKEASPATVADTSATPENPGNWRLNAVLEAFENLSPTREGRVKTLVRAFESLMSSESKDEQQQRKARGQFTYLSSTANSKKQGEKSQKDGLIYIEEKEEDGEEEEDEDEEGEEKQPQEAGHVSAQGIEESGESSEAESEKRLQDKGTGSDRQHHTTLHKFTVGTFASAAARKKPNNQNRKPQGSSHSIVPSRRPLQKPQREPAQLKAHFSKPQPFKLRTEERGHVKEQEFLTRLRRMLDEEERLRVPLAQGLPWSTDEPEVPYKPPVKDNTMPLDIHLNSDLRAMERAEFDRLISEKLLYLEQRRLEEERLRKIAEEEEIKKMRQEMVPKAQLMPYFDRPFRPSRSSKRPTIPKEPQFHHNKQLKRRKCVANS